MAGKTVSPYVVRVSGATKLQPKVLNIDGSDDAFYRYRMPQLCVQVVGKGKMIRTMLLNVEDVSKSLKVHPQYLTFFFGYEIGAQAKYDAKRPDRERASVSGEYDNLLMSQTLANFIKHFVLCANCNLPETSVKFDKKTQDISFTCHGCGHTAAGDGLSEKFRRFIQNHPLVLEDSFKKSKKDAKDAKDADGASSSTADADAGASSASTADSTGDADADAAAADAERQARKDKKKQEKLAAAAAAAAADEDDGSVQWSVDTSAEAAAKRKEAALNAKARAILLEGSAAAAAAADGSAASSTTTTTSAAPAKVKKEDPVKTLTAFLKNEHSAEEIVAEVKRLQEALNFTDTDRSCLLFDVLYPPKSVPKPEPKGVAGALKALVGADEMAQMSFLECLEMHCAEESALLKKFSLILKKFYDADIIEEDVIIRWDDQDAKNEAGAKAREAAAKLIDWLQSAEEEDE